MVEFIVSAVITLLVVVFAGWGLARMARPWVGRDKERLILLLERVLGGQAQEMEWRVFMSVPIRHHEFLESMRQHCVAIEQSHWKGVSHNGRFFTREGEALLREVLAELKAHGERDF